MTMKSRLVNLERRWPPAPPCAACASRPTIVLLRHADDPLPVPRAALAGGRCPQCGRERPVVPVLVRGAWQPPQAGDG